MRVLLVSFGLLAAYSAPAFAHEKGAIQLASKQVSVGGELSLRGDKLPKNATLRLQLRGTLETFPLADVRTDSLGGFRARFALPVEAKPGTYAVVVLASDGDIVARAELGIVAAPASMGEMSPEEHAKMNPDTTATNEPHATAENMRVPVRTSPAEWATIFTLIAASSGIGLALLPRSARGTAA